MTLRERALALVGTWSAPPDVPAKVALVVGVLFALAALFGRGHTLLAGFEHDDADEQRKERRRFLALAGLLSGLLSIAYVSHYLRGGPRIIDATSYFLQGRALSHGHFAWTPGDPTASFRGRFLLFRELAGNQTSLGGIFPPGYPLLLSFGFMLGAPMIVGPLLAIGLTISTYALTRAIAEGVAPALAERAARAAALLSVFCAALRYHTADTMSHGASALGVTLALTFAIRARQIRVHAHGLPPRPIEERSPFDDGRVEAAFAGLAVGYVFATRPISAVPIALVVGWLLRPVAAPSGRRSRLLLLALVSVLPGVFLLLLSQRVVTGSWFTSTQRAYYALADGPPGCFRFGFGKGIGCLFEHGDFVEARLGSGFGALAAMGTTLRRLHKHLLDVANLEPLTLLVLLPTLLRRRGSRNAILPATAAVLLQFLAYVPFYFDGDYPGGGARFFADVLPIEHALVVTGIAMVASRAEDASATDLRFVRSMMILFALVLVGFAVHASYDHVALRDRDGGRPMFEPDVLANASLKTGLVFVDTDHGFNLGHDPSARLPNGVVVARQRNDDRDRMLYEALGKPQTWLYKFDPQAKADSAPTLTMWTPPEPSGQRRFEAEAEWPPLAQEGGFAAPVWADGCASGKRALVVTPDAGGHAKVTVTLPVPQAGRWAVEVRTADGARSPHASPARPKADGTVTIGGAQWTWQARDACTTVPSKEVELTPPYARVTIEASGGPVGVDSFSLRKVR